MDASRVPSSLHHRPDTPALTYEQALNLLHVLENTKGVIETYVDILEDETRPRSRKTKSWWGRNCWPHKRKVLYANVTIITLSLQLLNLVILTVLDAWPKKDSGEQEFWDISAPTMIVLELLNLLLVIFASGRLAKQIFKHDVNSFFMAQAYMSTLLLFAGIYTVTYRLDRDSWKFINEDLYTNPVQVFLLYAKFLFFSISTATLCGSDNVLPVEWYNCLFSGFQMLLSFCYFASILGSAVSPDFAHANTTNTNATRPVREPGGPVAATTNIQHSQTTSASIAHVSDSGCCRHAQSVSSVSCCSCSCRKQHNTSANRQRSCSYSGVSVVGVQVQT